MNLTKLCGQQDDESTSVLPDDRKCGLDLNELKTAIELLKKRSIIYVFYFTDMVDELTTDKEDNRFISDLLGCKDHERGCLIPTKCRGSIELLVPDVFRIINDIPYQYSRDAVKVVGDVMATHATLKSYGNYPFTFHLNLKEGS